MYVAAKCYYFSNKDSEIIERMCPIDCKLFPTLWWGASALCFLNGGLPPDSSCPLPWEFDASVLIPGPPFSLWMDRKCGH